MIEKLSEIADMYENDFSRTIKYELKIKLLMKYRKLYEAINEIRDGIDFTNKIGMNMYVNQFYAIKARLQIILRDVLGAEESLLYAKEYISEVEAMPYYHSNFLLSGFILDLYRLEESIKTDIKQELGKSRRRALRSGRKMIKNAQKVACDRTEAFKLMGTYFWLIDKQKNALRWWSNSIKEGERLESRVEFARTYMEIGKRLLEEKSKLPELSGINAGEYLENARVLFDEMGLEWDLEELDKIISYR